MFSYDRLIIASGSTTLQTYDEKLSNVHTIDQIEQYEQLARDLSRDNKIAVIGSEHEYTDSPIVVKVKTTSFPITIRQHHVGRKVETRKLLEDDSQEMKVELFHSDTSVGVVEAGYAD